MTTEELAHQVIALCCYHKNAVGSEYQKKYWMFTACSEVGKELGDRTDAVAALLVQCESDDDLTRRNVVVRMLEIEFFRNEMTLQQANWLITMTGYEHCTSAEVKKLLNFWCLRGVLQQAVSDSELVELQKMLADAYPRLNLAISPNGKQFLLELAMNQNGSATRLVRDNAALMLRLPSYSSWLTLDEMNYVNLACAQILAQG